MSVTLTGDNNYSGIYDNIWVLGGANHGGNSDSDTTTGNEVFMFGNLRYKSTTVTDNPDGTAQDVTGGTYQSTATGSSNDTLHFSFTFHAGTPGATHNFLTEAAPQDYASDALGANTNGHPTGDGDADYQAQSDATAWTTNYTAWHTALAAEGATFTDSTTIETGVKGVHNPTDPDVNLTLDITAKLPGTPDTFTADHGGDKTLLGFSVGSDHVALDLSGGGSVSEAQFEQYFTISSSTHQSANHNTVNDTVISLNGGGWDVDLYGVNTADLQAAATTAGETLQQYVYNTIVSH